MSSVKLPETVISDVVVVVVVMHQPRWRVGLMHEHAPICNQTASFMACRCWAAVLGGGGGAAFRSSGIGPLTGAAAAAAAALEGP